MNAETKRHIDAARQVLVGVVPNPASQIDQITNALIYKFMDDMDQSAIKQGGDPSFFTGDLKDYAWTRLMDTRIGNQERMNIYSEALVKFSESKQLPQLFREIFKSAFLPYRSPEVLGLFLKEIDYFDYSHPEELGNAYEYLLSIMSSQGDAGQFRTPRHIIDFIVDVINPTAEDKVLDPACGTGGFLVSAYKHILEQHDGKNPDGSKNSEKPLTPDQRKNLMGNFEGYDIDPGMVRIAQVNMYLHQFKNPKIYNYDSLSMDERWNDKFDVVLANPPFMSPKGGVSTHNKFSIQSTRSEVLFVDYIMNHLRPKGRAGIIVPEGIIFQSGTSHKQLRKNLVNDGLYAVVSLPAGVFQPYSGVKTSILLFNNELAKQNKEVLFVKIENDGFDLSAQRRVNTKNDLPEALDVLNKWKNGKKVESTKAVFVEKSKIIENGDYNLSHDRYRVIADNTNTKWPMVKLQDISYKITKGTTPTTSGFNFEETGINFIKIESIDESGVFIKEKFAHISKECNDSLKRSQLNTGDVLFSIAGALGRVALVDNSVIPANTNQAIAIISPKEELNSQYLEYVLKSDLIQNQINGLKVGVAQSNLSLAQVSNFNIPLPSIEIQEKVVSKLSDYQNIINGAKQVIAKWRPVIEVDPKWGKTNMGDIIEVLTDYTANGSFASLKENVQYKNQKDFALLVRLTDLRKNLENEERKYVPEHSYKFLKKSSLFGGEYLIANVGANIGDVYLMPKIEQPATLGPNMYLVKFNNKVTTSFVYTISESVIKPQVMKASVSAAQPKINKDEFRKIEIPLPSVEIQKQIVERIEVERSLIEGNKRLIEIYEQKIRETLAKLWEQ